MSRTVFVVLLLSLIVGLPAVGLILTAVHIMWGHVPPMYFFGLGLTWVIALVIAELLE